MLIKPPIDLELFHCEQVSKEFATREGPIRALEEVTFGVREGEFVCIVGPSGCGKTTLLRLIAGLILPTSGSITFPQGVRSTRPAMVFQEHGLFPWMTILDNVAFGLEMQGVDVHTRRERATRFLETVGLSAFAKNYPHQLSVGMRQRVGVARAFVVEPQLLLMDEPFASLDAQTKLVLQDELLRLASEQDKSVVFVTHDIEEALRLGDRVLVMTGRPGHIREEINVGHPDEHRMITRSDPQLEEIWWRIWKMLQEQARADLSVPI